MDKSYRTKYAERLSKNQKSSFRSKPSNLDAHTDRPPSKPSSKYFNSEYAEKKTKDEHDNLTRLLRENHERNMKHLQSRFNNYVDHYLGLIQLKYKLYKLRNERERMDRFFDLGSASAYDRGFGFAHADAVNETDEEFSDEFEDIMSDLGLGKKKKDKKPESETNKPENCYEELYKRNGKKGFMLYNKYEDHSAELDLENGLFSIQIDVGGSKDPEILVDSVENHLTVISKDSTGLAHTFGIICPKVDDIDKLHVHYPKDGLLVIDGPTKSKSKAENKKARTVHM